MSETENSAVSEIVEDTSDAALENYQPADAKSVNDSLTAFFQNREAGNQPDEQVQVEEIENLSSETPETEEESAAAEATEPEKTEESAEKQAAETSEKPLDPAADTADFDSLTDEPEDEDYPTLESLKAEIPRQSAKLYEKTIQYAEQAKTRGEILDSLGGTHFVEPLKEVTKGIQDGDTALILKGIGEAAGQEATVKVIADSVHFAFNSAETLKANPETEDFGKALEAYTDTVIRAKFGESVGLETLTQFAEMQKAGWFDFLAESREKGWIDPDRFDELLEGETNPVEFQTLNQKIQSLEQQLADKEAADSKQPEKAVAQSSDSSFTAQTREEAKTLFSSKVLASSVLRDHPSDSPEMKTQKSFLRSQLSAEVEAAIDADTERVGRLAKMQARGEQSTARYKQLKAEVMTTAILKARENTSVAEAIAAKLYGKTRNAQVIKRKSVSPQQQFSNQQPIQNQPTQTQIHSEERKPTVKDVDKDLARLFADQ